jgi:hypothetical protein
VDSITAPPRHLDLVTAAAEDVEAWTWNLDIIENETNPLLDRRLDVYRPSSDCHHCDNDNESDRLEEGMSTINITNNQVTIVRGHHRRLVLDRLIVTNLDHSSLVALAGHRHGVVLRRLVPRNLQGDYHLDHQCIDTMNPDIIILVILIDGQRILPNITDALLMDHPKSNSVPILVINIINSSRATTATITATKQKSAMIKSIPSYQKSPTFNAMFLEDRKLPILPGNYLVVRRII